MNKLSSSWLFMLMNNPFPDIRFQEITSLTNKHRSGQQTFLNTKFILAMNLSLYEMCQSPQCTPSCNEQRP